MTDPRPSLAQQIEAVELAEEMAPRLGVSMGMTVSDANEFIARLQAAVETLQTLEFGSAIAR